MHGGALELVACHECDTLHRLPLLSPGNTARCRCCGAVLAHNPKGGLDRPIALNISALILLLLANAFPLLTLKIAGLEQVTTLAGAAHGLYEDGMPELAAVVFFTSVAGPFVIIMASLYVLLGIHYRWRLPMLRTVLVWISHINPWAMLDVFMLGILVSFVKLAGIADVIIGPAMYALVGLILVSAAAASAYEPALLWRRLGFPGQSRYAG